MDGAGVADDLASLTTAVVAGDEDRVQQLLSQGCNINRRGEGRPLLVAVKCENLAIAQLLIDHGARSMKHRKRSELHALAEVQSGPFPRQEPTTGGSGWLSDLKGWLTSSPSPSPPVASVQLWQLLMNAGASPFACDRNGVTPFHLACARGNWPVVQFLFQECRRVNVNKADKKNETPLHHAARGGHEAVVSLLLDHGAYPLAVGKQGTVSDVARQAGHMALARFIEDRGYQACPMLFMPFDVLAHVMAQLDPYDLCLVAQTCTTLNEVSSANCVWQRFGDSRWASSSSSVTKGGGGGGAQWSWKGRYMTWLRPRLQTYAQAQRAAHQLKATPNVAQYDHLFKFVITGDSAVGKTSLLYRLTDNVFSTGWLTSIGVDFRIKTIDLQGLRIKLQVWDSPAYPRTSNMARMYYRCASVMVVYDITSRESFHNVRKWVATFMENCTSDDGQSPVFLIVGTQNDLVTRRCVSPEEGQALAQELGAVGWHEVSSLNGSGVVEAFTHLAEVTLTRRQPFACHNGCHVPSEVLLQRLYAQSSTWRKAAAAAQAAAEAQTSATIRCLLQ